VCAAGGAQESGNGVGAIQLSVPVQETLARLREQWLVWNSAFLQGDREQASGAAQELLLTARELGMSRLSELAIGILVRSVEAAREGDNERARWGLEMAEQLDPGRAESAFARARVAYIDGSYLESFGAYVVGYLRVLRDVLQRIVWVHNLVLWVLAVLLVTAAMFVAVQMAVKGSLLYRHLAEFLAHHLPSFAAYAFAVVILVWPFVLPSGWVWGVLYWASLLMAYGSRSERLVLGGICGLFAVAPVVALEQQRGLEIALSDPMRAVERLSHGALYGAVFRDLGTLRTTLPESEAVGHLIADVHTLLGQDQIARPVYVGVLEAEPDNAGALVNLGNFHFHRREYIKAIEHYRRAVAVDAERVEAHYNLSQAYRSLLEFGDADTYLEQARRLDADRVNEWIAERVIVVPTREGLARRNEIRSELREAWPENEGPAGLETLVSEARSAPVALGALVLGIVLSFVRRRGGERRTQQVHSRLDRWVRALIPGLYSAEEGAGLRSLMALLLPIAALLLPIAGGLAYRIPWGYDPGNAFLWIVALAILVPYFLVRLRLVLG
jgi:tetratricopeptide (TPR) repeat protein